MQVVLALAGSITYWSIVWLQLIATWTNYKAKIKIYLSQEPQFQSTAGLTLETQI